MVRIAGFLKVRNEIVREGNLYRALAQLEAICDGGVICDDASSDGTAEHLREWVKTRPAWTLLEVPEAEQDFRDELLVKQRMLEVLHERHRRGENWDWIFWLDADEVLGCSAAELRAWVKESAHREVVWAFHYTQAWRVLNWARTDAGFDTGWFWKLWRYNTNLRFQNKKGTHHCQFPEQFLPLVGKDSAKRRAPFEILHLGNYGKNLHWKCIQYHGGLGGVDRHLRFERATYRPVPSTLVERGRAGLGLCPTTGKFAPGPFDASTISRILALNGLHQERGLFVVVIPAYNRVDTLQRALESLKAQTYEHWIALVLDDGSTDETPALMPLEADWDPRVFYCRYEENRGGVAMNNIGMAMACSFGEFWTRLGSDDWFAPEKLERDIQAFRLGADAVFAPFQVVRKGVPSEVCNKELTPTAVAHLLNKPAFVASWANVAVRTSVLREVRERFGSFCDPRLRNMEDFLVNVRIGRVAGWTWRPGCDGFWTCVPTGGASASANVQLTHADHKLTLEIIEAERST